MFVVSLYSSYVLCPSSKWPTGTIYSASLASALLPFTPRNASRCLLLPDPDLSIWEPHPAVWPRACWCHHRSNPKSPAAIDSMPCSLLQRSHEYVPIQELLIFNYNISCYNTVWLYTVYYVIYHWLKVCVILSEDKHRSTVPFHENPAPTNPVDSIWFNYIQMMIDWFWKWSQRTFFETILRSCLVGALDTQSHWK